MTRVLNHINDRFNDIDSQPKTTRFDKNSSFMDTGDKMNSLYSDNIDEPTTNSSDDFIAEGTGKAEVLEPNEQQYKPDKQSISQFLFTPPINNNNVKDRIVGFDDDDKKFENIYSVGELELPRREQGPRVKKMIPLFEPNALNRNPLLLNYTPTDKIEGKNNKNNTWFLDNNEKLNKIVGDVKNEINRYDNDKEPQITPKKLKFDDQQIIKDDEQIINKDGRSRNSDFMKEYHTNIKKFQEENNITFKEARKQYSTQKKKEKAKTDFKIPKNIKKDKK